MGLGNLAAGSELVVTRASGVSVWRIAWPVGLAGLTLAVIMFGIGEYAAPSMAQFAKRETTAIWRTLQFAGFRSAWVKDGNDILRLQTAEWIERLAASGPPPALHSTSGARLDPGRWRLHNVATSRFENDKVEGDTVSELTLRSTVIRSFRPRGYGSANADAAWTRFL